MALDKDVAIITSRGNIRRGSVEVSGNFEQCPECGEKTYVRCGTLAECYNELCPCNDNGDYP